MILQKQNITGNKYAHVFNSHDGSQYEIECTASDYANLAKPNPVNPTDPNGTWSHSYSFYKFDTLSGNLESGQYAIENAKQYLANLGSGPTPVPSSAFTGSTLNLALITKPITF